MKGTAGLTEDVHDRWWWQRQACQRWIAHGHQTPGWILTNHDYQRAPATKDWDLLTISDPAVHAVPSWGVLCNNSSNRSTDGPSRGRAQLGPTDPPTQCFSFLGQSKSVELRFFFQSLESFKGHFLCPGFTSRWVALTGVLL